MGSGTSPGQTNIMKKYTCVLNTVKKVIIFPVPSRDVTYQTLPGQDLLNNSWPVRVRPGWGQEKQPTFLQCSSNNFVAVHTQSLIYVLYWANENSDELRSPGTGSGSNGRESGLYTQKFRYYKIVR